MKKKKILLTILVVIFLLIFSIILILNYSYKTNKIKTLKNEYETTINNNKKDLESNISENLPTTITINAVGDCTIGTDTNFGSYNTFNSYLKNDDYSYYFKNVYDILSNDDITVANFEGTFTESNNRVDKRFNFKNSKEYVQVLLDGSVEVVNIANNHTYDYGVEGYNDTIEVLKSADVKYYGYDNFVVTKVKGITVGFAGFSYYSGIDSNKAKSDIDNAISHLKEQNVDLIIMSFHWGVERTYNQTDNQTEVGHYAIDSGANLVLGHHPHVLQGIEKYKDKYIVYSLGNFVFGGNNNPEDKDSMIFSQSFTFVNNELKEDQIKIIPVSISSKTSINNYQPTILQDSEKQRVIDKINKYSVNFSYSA